MVGWYISVFQQSPAERQAAHDRSTLLASWEASVGGIAWLEQLVAEGKAEQLLRNGYPSRYTALAKDVLPVIASGPPAHRGPLVIGDDYVMPGGWTGQLLVDQPKIDACPDNQPLTIDVWDQS